MNKYNLIHETTLYSLNLILDAGHLLRSSKTQQILEVKGQGSKNRKLATDPRVSLNTSNFYEFYDEVDGVYMRLQKKSDTVKSQFLECVLLFSTNILNKHSFVINTEENFGFLINEEGLVSESQFSGEPGFSITSVNNIHLLENSNFSSNEVVITDDVSIAHLRTIFFIVYPPIQIITKLEHLRITFYNIT